MFGRRGSDPYTDGRKLLCLGDEFPNFRVNTTIGEIDFHNWLGDSWGILFSHPSDFTPVCTTELARVVQLMPEFTKRNVKVIALSCDTIPNHKMWTKDIKSYIDDGSPDFPFPIIDDQERRIAILLGMLDRDERDCQGMPLTARSVFILDPKKKFRLSILYPATIGRNFNEILRTVDAMQLTEKHPIGTPADWQVGEDCMILPLVCKPERKFPKGVTEIKLPSGLKYMRKTPYP